MAESVVNPQAARWLIGGEWRAHPTRAVLAAVAIAVGVALGFAVHLINASALNEFAEAVRTVNGDADLQVRAADPRGFDERLFPRLARAPGVAGASPVVELPASLNGQSLTLIGADVLRAAAVTPALIGARPAGVVQGGGALDERAAHLSPTLMREAGLRPGGTARLLANGRSAEFRVAGPLNAAPEGQRLAVIDIAQAQWRFGVLGRLQRIDLKLAQGADPGRAARELRGLLPSDAQLTDRRSEARRSDSLSRAYRVNLDMLALVALLTGGFLVYSAQVLSVARRRPQFALLRVLGVTRRELVAQVLTEGLIVGVCGALTGLGLGLAVAWGALQLFGGDLGGGYFAGARPQLVLAPGAALLFLALGLAAALGGSALPAREAARARPAVALKNVGDAVDPRTAPNPRIALGLLAAGGLAALAPAIGGLPLFGYFSIALMLAGGVAAMPWLARVLLAPLHRIEFERPAVDLALKRIWGAPSQAAVALCGVVASTSLMIAMAVMVASFRGSVDEWLQQVLPADLYLRIGEVSGAAGGFDPDAQRRMAATPGVARIQFIRSTPLRLSPDQPPVVLIARDVDRADAGRTLPLIGRARPIPGGATPVWVSEPAMRLYGFRPGETIRLPIGGGVPVFVAGVWRDYARQFGAVTLDAADYTRLTGDATRTEAAVELAPGASAAQVGAGLRAATPPALAQDVTLAEPRQLQAMALRVFDRSFAVTYLLEGVAIVVGLLGVAATFSAQALARTKEFGMLRHLGVLRRQILAMLALEGALLGFVGVVAGVGLGVAMSQVLIQVVNPQSFHWTMETRLPWRLFAGVAATLTAAAAGAALLAGRRAVSQDAVQAVREDW